MRIETIAEDNNLCGEGPIWDAAGERLVWNDCGSSLIFDYHPASGRKRVLNRGVMASGIALNADGRLILAGTGGIHLWAGPGSVRTLASEHCGEAMVCNDLVADSAGRIYFGTYHWGPNGRENSGKLFLFGLDGTLAVVDDGIELANGLGLSPAGHALYFSDSAARTIYAYDVVAGTGHLARKRVFARVPSSDGIPDGLTVDAEGFVWCAQWYGGQVVRYDRDGRVERRIALPAAQVSSVAFGGPELNDLYVTSAAEPWRSDYAPTGFNFGGKALGGSLYRVRLDVVGRPEHLGRFET